MVQCCLLVNSFSSSSVTDAALQLQYGLGRQPGDSILPERLLQGERHYWTSFIVD